MVWITRGPMIVRDADVLADAARRAEVSVTFPQSGTVTFFCEYHRASGMLGGLQAA
jgi:plastocyanin